MTGRTLVIGATALLEPATGVGIYTREIALRLPALMPDWRIRFLVAAGVVQDTLPEPPAPDAPTTPRNLRARLGELPLVGPPLRETWQRWQARRHPLHCDAYWEPNNLLDMRVHADRRILTVHDYSWRRHPQWHPRQRVEHFRRHFARSLREATAIITGSAAIRDEILADAPWRTAERIAVIHHGVDTELFRPQPPEAIAALRTRLDLPRRYILAVGTLEPRKNLATLVAAFRIAAQRDPDLHLLLAGAAGWRNHPLLAQLAALGPRARRLGYLPRQDLPALYAGAAAVAYPSVYEGFGLPPVEAAACGAPVLVAEGLPALAVLGPAARALPACEVSAWANALLSDMRPAHAASLPTWAASAHDHAAILLS